MKYNFTFKVEGNWYESIEADSTEEAEEKITDLFYAANFGELQFINGKPLFYINESTQQSKWYMLEKGNK